LQRQFAERLDGVSHLALRSSAVGAPELESGTSSLSATRSNQLSYAPVRLKPHAGIESPIKRCRFQSRMPCFSVRMEILVDGTRLSTHCPKLPSQGSARAMPGSSHQISSSQAIRIVSYPNRTSIETETFAEPDRLKPACRPPGPTLAFPQKNGQTEIHPALRKC
jgi:hypothetical protein